MSIRLEMLQVARLAPKVLGDSAELVARFIRSQQNEDGGFKDRTGRSDLYYTVFGLDALAALQQPIDPERVHGFLTAQGAPEDLDFVHLCAAARCRTAIAMRDEEFRLRALARLAAFRVEDGGFNPVHGSGHGTAYGAFLGLAAYQDVSAEMPAARELARSLQFLETPDGAWTNELTPKPSALTHPGGSTNATAAAVSVLRNLGVPVNPAAGEWLLRRAHPQGGFMAIPNAPIPDLLSTATALHAISGLGLSIDGLREGCLDFIDSLWTNEGSFHGNWTDDHLDCEYTFYGLLALGHLSV